MRTPRRKAIGSVRTTIQGIERATSRRTSGKLALRRTKKSVMTTIVRMSRTKV